jgi:hypothetical protein
MSIAKDAKAASGFPVKVFMWMFFTGVTILLGMMTFGGVI